MDTTPGKFEYRHEWRGKTLTFCTRGELLACTEELQRQITACRELRDQYHDRALAAEQVIESLCRDVLDLYEYSQQRE